MRNPLRHTLLPLLLVAGLAAGSMPAYAGFVEVPLPVDNAKLQDLTAGSLYPASGPLTVGGVPFTIAQDANGNNIWATFLLTVPVLTIPVNVFGVVTGYTLMDSFFGFCGTTIGKVEFNGSGGAFASFDLIEGTNIRDHYVNPTFCQNIAAGTPTMAFSGSVLGIEEEVRLDRQTFSLPAAFATQTLTNIVLTGYQQFGFGEPFITSVTVENGAVPEPGTLLLLGMGLGAFASVGRTRRQRLTA